MNYQLINELINELNNESINHSLIHIYIPGSSARFARALAYGIILRRYITAYILRQIYYGRYITATILRQIRYGRYIAYHKNGHISTNVRRQKLSIAASESACCNASPQGLPCTVLSIKRPHKSKKRPPGTRISVRWVPLSRKPHLPFIY